MNDPKMILVIEEERQAAILEAANLRAALSKLVAKITAIEADLSFQGIWGLLHAHGYVYSGPDWRDDLADARAVLNAQADRHE